MAGFGSCSGRDQVPGAGRSGLAAAPNNRCTFLGASSLPLRWLVPGDSPSGLTERRGRAMTPGALLLFLLGVLGAHLAPGSVGLEAVTGPRGRGGHQSFTQFFPPPSARGAGRRRADSARNFSQAMIARCGRRGVGDRVWVSIGLTLAQLISG